MKKSTPSQKTVLNDLVRQREVASRLVKEANDLLMENGLAAIAFPACDPLRLVVTGEFNAGKSTLINAILGSKVCKTGGVPTTRHVETFEWNGVRIADLPGFEARPEEQDAAMVAARDAHVILYMISSVSGFDQRPFWNTLRSFLQANLPVIVVVNDKRSYQSGVTQSDEDKKEEEREQERARLDLVEKFQSQQAEHLPGVSTLNPVWLHALRAENGRLQNSPVMIEKSGILLLEQRILELVTERDAFLRACSQIRDVIKALVGLRAHLTQGCDPTGEESRLVRILAKCDATQEKLGAIAEGESQTLFSSLCKTLESKLIKDAMSGAEAKGEEDDDEINDLIQDTVKCRLKGFDARVREEMGPVYADLSQDMPEADGGGAEEDEEYSIPNMKGKKSGETGKTEDTAQTDGERARQILNNLWLAFERGRNRAGSGAGKAADLLGRKISNVRINPTQYKPFIKGVPTIRPPSRFPKLPKVKWGVILQSVQTVWSISKEWREEGRKKALVMAAIQEASAKARLACEGIRTDFHGRACRILSAVQMPARKEAARRLETLTRENREVSRKLKRLEELREALSEVSQEMAGKMA